MFKTNSLYLPFTTPLFPPFSQLFKKHYFFPSCSSQKVEFIIKSSLYLIAHMQSINRSSIYSTFKTHLKYDHYFSLPPHPPQFSHCPLSPHWSPCLISSLQSDPYKWKFVRHFLYYSSQEQNFKYSSGIQILCIRFFLCHQHWKFRFIFYSFICSKRCWTFCPRGTMKYADIG